MEILFAWCYFALNQTILSLKEVIIETILSINKIVLLFVEIILSVIETIL